MFRARSARSKRARGEGEEKAVREDSKKETRKFRNWAQLKTSKEPERLQTSAVIKNADTQNFSKKYR